MASNITLNSTITWAKSFLGNLDPTVMPNFEPAITCANLVKMVMLGPPFKWRFNRVTTGFVTTTAVQDYLVSAWASSMVFALNTLIVDSNGNSQQVTTAGTTGGTAPTWNVTTGQTTTDGGVTWTNLGPFGGGSSSYTFGFVETASVQDTSVTPAKWFEVSPNLCLGLDSSQARPREISAQKDDNAGNITFRLMPVPDKAYPVSITLQQKTTLFAAITNSWSPIPDEYSYIYNWGFLALMLLYADYPAWGMANQKFTAALLGAQQGLTETERNIFLNNWEAVTGQQGQNAITMQQGKQARGM